MRKKTFILPSLTFIIILFLTQDCFSQDTTKQILNNDTTAEKKLNTIQILLDKSNAFYGKMAGHEIDSKYVLPCSRLFAAVMAQHGIEPSERDINIKLIRSIVITDWESFAGPGLSQWITNVPKQFPNADTNKIEIRIIFGVYTSEFIASFPEASNRKNRITAFLVPYLITGDPKKSTTATMGSIAYELGNLHP